MEAEIKVLAPLHSTAHHSSAAGVTSPLATGREGTGWLSELATAPCQLSSHHSLGWEIRQVAGKAWELCLSWRRTRPSINKHPSLPRPAQGPHIMLPPELPQPPSPCSLQSGRKTPTSICWVTLGMVSGSTQPFAKRALLNMWVVYGEEVQRPVASPQAPLEVGSFRPLKIYKVSSALGAHQA